MNITESKLYEFHFDVDGTGYNFQIPAKSKNEAIGKLTNAMHAIAAELQAGIEDPPKTSQASVN